MNDTLTVKKDLVFDFGDRDDGAIGIPGITEDGKVIETSYFFGKARPKNIIVVSSQAGCPMRCTFCELGEERFARNLSPEEIRDQAVLMLEQAQMRGFDAVHVPHKVTVANSGEPLLNAQLVDGLDLLAGLPVRSFKISTVLPRSEVTAKVLADLADFAARTERPVQLQISLISTLEERRFRMSPGAASFRKIREAGEIWHSKNPTGRKVNLSLILAEKMPCVAADVVGMFPSELFRFRFREYVPTENGRDHGIREISPERLADIKREFAGQGYEVGDWASPSPMERKFGLASNVIRKTYLRMTSPIPA